jgi:hypothetical protein
MPEPEPIALPMVIVDTGACEIFFSSLLSLRLIESKSTPISACGLVFAATKKTITSDHQKSEIWALQKKEATGCHLHPEMLKSTRPRVNVSDQTVDLGSNFFTGSV